MAVTAPIYHVLETGDKSDLEISSRWRAVVMVDHGSFPGQLLQTSLKSVAGRCRQFRHEAPSRRIVGLRAPSSMEWVPDLSNANPKRQGMV